MHLNIVRKISKIIYNLTATKEPSKIVFKKPSSDLLKPTVAPTSGEHNVPPPPIVNPETRPPSYTGNSTI